MTQFLTQHEPLIRLSAFLAVALAMGVWEVLAPRRPLARDRSRRWPVNLAVAAADTVLVRVAFPAAVLAGIAALAAERHWGLFNTVAAQGWIAFLASVIALDLAVYGQHVAFHHVPVLWRLHRMHHCDLDVDFTTALRFHPLEIVLSVLLKAAVVLVIGAPVAAVIAFEIVLNAAAMFNHGNVRLSGAADRALSTVVVTPDMHRVHHSWIRRETDSNFGFCLSWWDRLFGTYRPQPEGGHDAMTLGLPSFRGEADQRLWRMLLNPFAHERRTS